MSSQNPELNRLTQEDPASYLSLTISFCLLTSAYVWADVPKHTADKRLREIGSVMIGRGFSQELVETFLGQVVFAVDGIREERS